MVQSKAIKRKRPVRKKKQVKRKTKVVRRKKNVRRPGPQYITGNHMTDNDLSKFVGTLKKVRKYKRTAGQKKTGLTNVMSLLNLLYNSEREKRKKPTRNLMYTHPYNYPSLIPDVNVDNIWKSTGIKTSRTRTGIISNINDVYNRLYGYQLIKAPVGLPQSNQQNEQKIPYALPVKPSRTPPPKVPRELPSKPSMAPPPKAPVDDDDELDSSSSEDEEELL